VICCCNASFVTTKKSGTGLGLSISRQIVAEHGGFLRIESRVVEYAWVSVDLLAAENLGNIENPIKVKAASHG
jgi:signal transduction histidine kinase